MASKIDTQSNHNNELTPFVIANDCPQEKYRINLQNNPKFEEKPLQRDRSYTTNKNQPQPFDTLSTSNTTE